MKFCLFAFLCLISLPAAAADWQPPESPNPQAILNSIRNDVQAQAYETALAKQVWFHENALKYQPGMSGVRLSFALSYWKKLAEVYPPALEKLKEIRDEASQRVLDGKDVWQSFQDLAALNRTLDEDTLTSDTFLLLHQQQPPMAKRVFLLAEPALLKASEYQVCGQYLEPEKSYQRMVQSRQLNHKLAQNPQIGPRILEYTDKKFTNDTTILVALLVFNDRVDEARTIADKARQEWANANFHKALDSALTGKVPPSWPY